jgi:hypothetical protein
MFVYIDTKNQGLLARGPLIAKCTQYSAERAAAAAAATDCTREAAGLPVGSSLAVGPAGRTCERNGSGEGAVGLVVSMGVGAWRFSSPV